MPRSRAPRNPWANAMWQVLSDGQWHPLERVVRAGMPLVPPNYALVSWRRYVVKQRDHADEAEMSPRFASLIRATSTSQQIRDGQWHRCRHLLLTWRKQGLIDIDPPGHHAKNKRVRLRDDSTPVAEENPDGD